MVQSILLLLSESVQSITVHSISYQLKSSINNAETVPEDATQTHESLLPQCFKKDVNYISELNVVNWIHGAVVKYLKCEY